MASASSVIREVWDQNLETEMATIREVILDYPYISMDTEFPGVVAKPISNFKSSGDYHYQTIRTNVDLLKIIQLGLTLSNEKGELAPNVCTYQFNFKFSLETDIYAQDSIDLLTRSGIDFKRCAERVGIHVTCFPRDFQLQRHSRHEEHGIDIHEFAELLMCSGVVLCDDVHWVTFHSGYDFGYILKLLTCKPLPADEDEFFAELLLYCPHVHDIKFLMKHCENLKGGLNGLAKDLQVERIGPEHQAGSDSLLTQATYFKLRSLFFEDLVDENKFDNILFGLGKGCVKLD